MGIINPELVKHGSPRVTVVDCGKVVKYQLTDYKPRIKDDGENLPPYFYIRDSDGNVIDHEHYVSVDTGEIKEFKKSYEKGDNLLSLSHSFARLRDLINANYDSPAQTLFVTFTYSPARLRRFGSKLTLKKVSKDMRNTFQRMRASNLPPFRYIYVVEQQGNGNWHTHLLMFFDSVPQFIPQDELDKWWQHGFVKVSKRFTSDDAVIANVGAYVCSYLTDDLTDEHKRVKNARLMHYPTNTHLHRCSQNVRRPEKYDIPYAMLFEQLPSDFLCSYGKTNDVEIERG